MHLPYASNGLPNHVLLETPPDTHPLALTKVHEIASIAKQKTKDVLNIDTPPDEAEKNEYKAAIGEINDGPAFNSSQFLKNNRVGSNSLQDKTKAAFHAISHFIASPNAALKTRATRRTAKRVAKSQPYFSRESDLAFLEAHDGLNEAAGWEHEEGDHEAANKRRESISNYEEQIRELEAKRQSMRVAWITSRHVGRVRAIDSKKPPPLNNDFFERPDDCGYPEFHWGEWAGSHLLSISHNYTAKYIDDFDNLPYDSDSLRRHVERLITVSAPLQMFLTDVRQVYKWDDPARTGRWLAIHLILCYFSQNLAFLMAYTFYRCMKNYFYPSTVEGLRQGMERTSDGAAGALEIGELVEKHGTTEWLEPLLDEIGPYMQVQAADIADSLEITDNFFHWRNPAATRNVLCLLGAMTLVVAIVDGRLLAQIAWLGIGFIFFGCWPISALYPRYRLLVNPFKWMFWDVPTHAEWCFQHLNDRASIARNAILSRAAESGQSETGNMPPIPLTSGPSNPDGESFETAGTVNLIDERDLLRFSCTCQHVPGHLIISTASIRFVPTSNPFKQPSFTIPYPELVELTKRHTRSTILNPAATEDKLEIRFRGRHGGTGTHSEPHGENATVVLLENMSGRDKAFNAIVGFSGLRWQHLQKEPDRDAKPTK